MCPLSTRDSFPGWLRSNQGWLGETHHLMLQPSPNGQQAMRRCAERAYVVLQYGSARSMARNEG